MKISWIFILLLFLVSCNLKSNDTNLIRLNIETYLAGKNQPTHPSVVTFKNAWNGYKYWMAYSPFPYANGEEENPCIAVSNDMYYWESPKGLSNPIAYNEETGCDELKDPHLVYRPDLDRLELWYLGRLSENLGGDGKQLMLFRKTSADGLHWSKYEVMCPMQYLSQSIIWEIDHYTMWSVGFGTYKTTGTFVRQISYDGVNWTMPDSCTIDDNSKDLLMWHAGVSFFDNAYHLVFIDKEVGNTDILYAKSLDGVHFLDLHSIKHNDEGWNRFYRPHLIKEADKFWLFYGAITDNNAWYVTMSSGEKLDEMYPITKRDIVRMRSLSDSVDNNYWSSRIKSVKERIRIELILLLPLILLVLKLAPSKRWLIFMVVVVLTIGYTFTIYRFGSKINVCISMISALFLVCTIWGIADSLTHRHKK